MTYTMSDDAHLLQTKLSRRTLLKYSMAGLVGLTFGCAQSPPITGAQSVRTSLASDHKSQQYSTPPLFCIAYIDPDIPSQANQEPMVARYPLALVPQDRRRNHALWRDRIKTLNPGIIMLGYQLVIDETTVPGPGHDRLRLAKESWCIYPNGHVPRIPPKSFRVYDPRKVEWQEAFLDACRITLESYPYDGLFLDDCTVFDIAHPSPAVRAEMREGLQATLLRLRKEFPNTILVGNASENWNGLNGELNEGRPEQILKETAPYSGHVLPAMDLYHTVLDKPSDVERVRREMALAHSQEAYYSAAVDMQHVLWFDVFDEVIAKHK